MTQTIDAVGQIFEALTPDHEPVEAGRGPCLLDNGTFLLPLFFHGSFDNEACEFYYSNDAGVTWAKCGGDSTITANNPLGAPTPGEAPSIFQHANGDLYLAYRAGSTICCLRGTWDSGTNTITWADNDHVETITPSSYRVDLCAFDIGTDTYIAVSTGGIANNGFGWFMLKRTSGGTWSTYRAYESITTDSGNTRHTTAEFRHTGDGRTPTATPDIYIAGYGDNGSSTNIQRFEYSAGPTWAGWGNVSLSATSYFRGQTFFDGTHVVAVYKDYQDSPYWGLKQYDYDMSTLTILSTGAPLVPNKTGQGGDQPAADIGIFFDLDENIYVVQEDDMSQIYMCKWTRTGATTGTWDSSWTAVVDFGDLGLNDTSYCDWKINPYPTSYHAPMVITGRTLDYLTVEAFWFNLLTYYELSKGGGFGAFGL
jgi:hypothetical protein